MSTRRRIGVSIATTEAARRQLMQPVPVWEKRWETPVNTQISTNLKVYKWVKTDKIQQFSDDEGEVDEPLAPLPDEPDPADGDDDIDQDDANPSQLPPASVPESLVAGSEAPEDPSKPPSPKATLLLEPSFQGPLDGPSDAFDTPLKPLHDDPLDNLGVMGNIEDSINPNAADELDMSGLGPDGTSFEASGDLTQLGGQEDELLSGMVMDESLDPFAGGDTGLE